MRRLSKNEIVKLHNFAGIWKLLWYTNSFSKVAPGMRNKWCAFNLGSGRCEYVTSRDIKKRGAK